VLNFPLPTTALLAYNYQTYRKNQKEHAMAESPQETAEPLSLRDDAPMIAAPAPDSRSNALVVGLAVLLVGVFVIAIVFAGPFRNNSSSLTEDDVRRIVAEAVGTQVAGLRPTNTPIPPTPTVIPRGIAEDDDPFRGPEDAPVVIVEFSDYQCVYCGRFYNETLPLILEKYPDQVKFVYRDFPIFGEDSVRAAMAGQCAHDQGKFWEMHDRIFAHNVSGEEAPLSHETFMSYADELGLDATAFGECLSTERYLDEVVNDYRAAQDYGLQGTPGFVIDGMVYPIGAQPFEVFDGIIQSELARLGVTS
jgi:protein-disulfide isomerase